MTTANATAGLLEGIANEQTGRRCWNAAEAEASQKTFGLAREGPPTEALGLSLTTRQQWSQGLVRKPTVHQAAVSVSGTN